MIWTKKYAPQSLKDLVGDEKSILQINDFVNRFDTYRKKASIIYGPTGTGKTEAVYALAKENDLEVLEINASDFRNKEHILETVGKSINQASLFGREKLILVDEVDGLSGRKDRGGATALASLIAKTSFPIVMTANDPWQSKLSGLRKKCNLIEFPSVNYLEIFKVLKRIADSEGINVSDEILKSIANTSGGDIRSAINDFQSVSFGREELTKEHLEDIGERGKEEDIFNLLRVIFKSTDSKLILKAFDDTNLKFDEVMLWVEENLPKEYSGIELKDAYDKLSKADIFKRRIMRRQHWRFMVYQKYLMSAGVASCKVGSKKGFVDYERSKKILKLWMAKMKYGKRNSISEKISEKCHLSKKKSVKDVFPYIKLALNSERDYLDLGEEEINWITR
ncbi:replication factor C large subunit [Candidatus Woesearchaeota archaeon]|jgi:replication factor C large subunit|nr:replication factor C large subunit [Candidatus Woesearchaeota archaeon]